MPKVKSCDSMVYSYCVDMDAFNKLKVSFLSEYTEKKAELVKQASDLGVTSFNLNAVASKKALFSALGLPQTKSVAKAYYMQFTDNPIVSLFVECVRLESIRRFIEGNAKGENSFESLLVDGQYLVNDYELRTSGIVSRKMDKVLEEFLGCLRPQDGDALISIDCNHLRMVMMAAKVGKFDVVAALLDGVWDKIIPDDCWESLYKYVTGFEMASDDPLMVWLKNGAPEGFSHTLLSFASACAFECGRIISPLLELVRDDITSSFYSAWMQLDLVSHLDLVAFRQGLTFKVRECDLPGFISSWHYILKRDPEEFFSLLGVKVS